MHQNKLTSIGNTFDCREFATLQTNVQLWSRLRETKCDLITAPSLCQWQLRFTKKMFQFFSWDTGETFSNASPEGLRFV